MAQGVEGEGAGQRKRGTSMQQQPPRGQQRFPARKGPPLRRTAGAAPRAQPRGRAGAGGPAGAGRKPAANVAVPRLPAAVSETPALMKHTPATQPSKPPGFFLAVLATILSLFPRLRVMSKSGRTPKGSAVAVQVVLEFRDKDAVLEDMESEDQESGGGSGGALAMPGEEPKEVQGEAVRVGPAPAPPKPKRPRPPALQVPPLGSRRRLMPGAKPAAPAGAPRPLLIRATAIEAAARKLKFSPKRPAPQPKQAGGPARAIQSPPPPPPEPPKPTS